MLTIRLIGIGGDHRYESWKANTQYVIQELELQGVLEEVNEIEAIINSKISAIPALIIHDTILLEQNSHIPDIEEIKGAILKYLDK